MKNPFSQRQALVMAALPNGLGALLVTHLPNVRYLCGFTGSAGVLLLEPKKTVFFTDFRYQEQSVKEIGDAAKVVVYKTSAPEAVLEYLGKTKIKAVGVEGALRLDTYETYKDGFKGKLTLTSGLVETVRQIKDESELELLREAFGIADRAFARLMKFVKPGKPEIEISARLEYLLRMEGAEGPSFPTIVASGERAACPHAQPTDRKLAVGEMVKIDFGAVWQGYHSDMTRTIFLGKADAKFREVYKIVLDAQKKAVEAIKPGAKCFDIDKISRDHIVAKGYGEYFGHGLGHALGLEIHEAPAYSPRSKAKIASGMVLTVEPGIYIPGWGGVRIEDVYVVTPDGPQRLTATSNTLHELK